MHYYRYIEADDFILKHFSLHSGRAVLDFPKSAGPKDMTGKILFGRVYFEKI